LKSQKIDRRDIDTYLGTCERRVASVRTGAQWALDSLAAMGEQGRAVDRYRALTAAMVANSGEGEPCTRGSSRSSPDTAEHKDSFRTVGRS
jgi:hypothetical protein